MKISGFWLGFLLASMACASAQVTVEVTQDQEQFLPGEALKVAVRITNLSGQELHLGREDDWLTFSVESPEGIVVPQVGEAPVVGEFVLESSKVAIKRLDLSPYFTLTQPGRYEIVATAHITDWNRDVASVPKPFNLIEGAKLWEQDVGVPKSAGATNAEPEIRRYILQQANYLRGQLRLYIRVTDFYGKPVRVVMVGPILTFSQPEPQVDKFSNLHVLYQDGPYSFNYTVCNLQGEVITRQTYDYVDSRPRLRLDDEGNLTVKGGIRRIAANDVPQPKNEPAISPPPPLLPDSGSSQPTNQLSVTKPSR